MLTMLSKNINDFEETIKSFGNKYEYIRIIEQENNNNSEKLII